MKIVFLDFDFCLNSRKSFAYYTITDKRSIASPDNYSVALLDYLLFLMPDLYIVVSSSWRHVKGYEVVKENLKTDFGLLHYERVIGQTPFDKNRHRGKEIDMWLRQSETEVFNYVIIDDDSDFLDYQLPRHVQTDENGFSTKHLDQAYSLLGGDLDKLFSGENTAAFKYFYREKSNGPSI